MKVEFSGSDFENEKAFEVYSNSDFNFFEKNDVYYYSVGRESEKCELGDIKAVEQFLLEYAD